MIICSLHYVDSVLIWLLFKDAILEACICFSYQLSVCLLLYLFGILLLFTAAYSASYISSFYYVLMVHIVFLQAHDAFKYGFTITLLTFRNI